MTRTESAPLPTVTVCIPVYNRSQALRPTLDSVLAQTLTDWELLVIDDGSTDDTPEVVRSYTDPRVRYLRQENAGGAAARNRGLAEARAPYLAYLDHDDRWEPEKLARQVAYLDDRTEYGLVYSRLVFVNEEDQEIGAPDLPGPEGDVFQALLEQHNFVFTMSNPLMRTDLVRQVGGIDFTADMSDDWELFLRLARITRFGRIDGALVRYNLGNDLAQTRNVWRVYESEGKLVQRYQTDRSIAPGVRRKLRSDFRRRFAPAFRTQGWKAMRESRHSAAWKCYLRALALRPAYLLEAGLVKDLASLIMRSIRPSEPTKSGS